MARSLYTRCNGEAPHEWAMRLSTAPREGPART